MPYKVKKITRVDTSSLETLGQSVVDLSKYTEDEFGIVSQQLQVTEADPILFNPPPKPRRGTYAYADGTHWNPGAGEGPYYFNGTSWVALFQTANTGAVVVTVKKQIFTASGTYTPSVGMLYCIIECVGGGGAGGGASGTATFYGIGSGGAAGAYSRLVASAATVGVSKVVTIGVGGVPGAAGNVAGGNGGDTSVGSLCLARGANGGNPCATANAASGAVGGAGSTGTGDLKASGQNAVGGYYQIFAATASIVSSGSGQGANSPYGGGGSAGGTNASGSAANGVAATGFGAGGGGGACNQLAGSNASGGAGAPGVVFVTEFCSQ
jgi:hypothetical protein